MRVTCQYCSYSFDDEPPGYGTGETTVCPSCGRATPFVEGGMFAPDAVGAGGTGEQARVYCFNCGKAMTPREGELIPVCDECRQDASQPAIAPVDGAPPETHPTMQAEEPIADWMIRKANGNVYGPFPAATIVEWISARKINPDEEVAHIGGAWRLFGQHEEFGKHFEAPGDVATSPQRTGEIDFRRRSPVRDLARTAGRIVAGVGAVAAIAFGVWWAISNDILVLPESAVQRVADKVSDTARGDAPAPLVSEDAQRILRALQESHSAAAQPAASPGSSMERFLRGRTLMLRDGVPDLLAARTELEIAVVLDPSNALALAGLAELYGLLAARNLGSLDLQRQTIYLIELAEQQGTYEAEVLRARAAWLVYLGRWDEGVAVAEQALQKNPADPWLHYLLGVAAAGRAGSVTEESRARFDKALELDAGFHQVWFELGRGEEAAGHLKGAIDFYEKKISLDARSGAAHQRLGAIWEAVGDHGKATSHYDKAIALNPRDKDAVVRRAILAYQVDGAPGRAEELLTSLQGEAWEGMSIRERKEIGVHISAARRLAGNAQGALDAVEVVLKEDRGFSPALFHKALALVAAGRPNEAIPLFTRADSQSLLPRERALIQFWSGRAAFVGGQRQDALDAYGRAIEFDPDILPAYLWRAEIGLSLGDAQGAVSELLGHIGRDPLDYARAREPGLFYEPMPDLGGLADGFVKAADAVTFAPDLFAVTGMILFHAGRTAEAREWLGRAIGQDARNEGSFFYLGLAESRETQHSRATAQFLAATQVENRGVYYVYLADSYLDQGRLDEAIGAYERAMGYGARSSWSHSRLAEALARSGQPDRAREQIDLAVAQDPAAVAPRRQCFLLDL